jgi:phenylalanyl-tRNA synthetase beta chain
VAEERPQVGGVLWGARDGVASWTSGEARVDFWDAKGAVEAILGALHVAGATFEPLESPWYHPRASAQVRAGGLVLGTVGELHPRARKALDAPEGVFAFQLDVEHLESVAALVPQARGLGKFPSVLRDLAVVVEAATPAASVRALILEVGLPLVTDARVFDVYAGPQVGEGKKSLAFALTYRAPDRTLTDAEVAQAHQRIVGEVAQRLGGALRA